MSKQMWAVGAVVVLVGGWAAGVTYSGQRVQSAFQAQNERWQASKGLLRVVDAKLERGWLSTTRTMTVELGVPPSGEGAASGPKLEPLRMQWRDHAQHGPLPGGQHWGAALITSEGTLDDAQRAALKAQFNTDVAPIRATTLVGLGGSTDTQLDMPAFGLTMAEGPAYLVQGLKARLQGTLQGVTQHDLSIASVDMVEPRFGLSFKQLDTRSQGESIANEAVWWGLPRKHSSSSARMEINLRRPDPESSSSSAPTSIVLQDIKGLTTGQLDGELYGAASETSGTGTVGAQKLDAWSVKSEIKRIHLPSFVPLMEAALSGDLQPQPTPESPEASASEDTLQVAQAQLDQFKSLALKMLPHNPEISLSPLSVTVNGETGTLGYRIATQGISPEDLTDDKLKATLSQKSLFSLDASIPQAWLKALAGGQTASEEEAQAAVQMMVEPAIERGWVKREGTLLKASLQFEQAVLKLNGQPLPVPPLFGAE